MGRSCPSMPPFNVDIFVFQPVSPMDSPTLKGASRHKHGSKVNFVQDGSRFHAASGSKSCCYPLSGFQGLDFLSGFVKTDFRVWISYVNIVSALQGPGSLPNSSSGPSFLFWMFSFSGVTKTMHIGIPCTFALGLHGRTRGPPAWVFRPHF